MHRNVLLLGNGTDTDRLDQVLKSRVNLKKVQSARDALAEIERSEYDVVLCQGNLPEANWRWLLGRSHAQRPEVPVIVFHHCGCEQEWLEVLDAGAFDLLCPPYQESQVMATIEHAVASRYASHVAGSGAGRTPTAMAGRK